MAGKSMEARQLAARLNRQTAIENTRFHYEKDEYNSAYRVWQTGNPGDVFDLIPYDTQNIKPLLDFFQRHPSMFVEGMPEDGE